MAQAAPELYGGRVRLLGVVDRESITEAARPVDDTVFTWPHLLVRHVVVALGTLGRRARASRWRSAHRSAASRTRTSRPEPAKAPWYFAGLQELLSRFDPLVAGILVPAGAVLVFVLLPYIDRNPDTRASHRKVAILLFSVLLAIAVGLTVDRSVLPRARLEVHRPVDPLVHRVLGAPMDDKSRRDFLRGGWKLGGALLIGAAAYTGYEALRPLASAVPVAPRSPSARSRASPRTRAPTCPPGGCTS